MKFASVQQGKTCFPLCYFIGEKDGDKTAGSEAIDSHSRIFGETRKDTNTRPSLFRH
jgi:hypothetical protein